MLALVLVIVAMVSALTAMRFAIHGQEVAVPLLVERLISTFSCPDTIQMVL